jgi:formate/nitrite transporter FocA (FNT family)
MTKEMETEFSATETSESQPSATSESPIKQTRMTANEIYENVRTTAEDELNRSAQSLFWSAIAAGLTIGFSFFAGAYLTTLVPENYHSVASAVGYPLGFIFVVLARQQLFTENTLEPIIPLLHRPSWSIVRNLLALWAIVLFGNLVGAVVFAGVLAKTPMTTPEFQKTLLETAADGTSGGFLLVTYRGIFAGWLIALMAWLIASTRATGAQLLLIWLTTAPISAFGFRHSIAGSVEAFYQAWTGAVGWGQITVQFIMPAIIGNIIGGVVLVAILNHGQVVADRRAAESE